MAAKFFSLPNIDFSGSKNFLDIGVLQNFFNIRTLVSILGRLALVLAVWLSVYIGELFKNSENQSFPTFNFQPEDLNNLSKQKPSFDSYRLLASSQLFGKAKPSSTPVVNNQTSGSLSKLKLIAINSISNGRGLAIIEDTNKQNQEVFEINENVFNQGKLAEILKDSVKIEINGRLETLVMKDTVSSSGDSPASEISDNQTDFSLENEELTQALNNLPQLLSQARAVPYFRNGQSIGMRLFAIRSGSLYEKLGLKNGDILLAVNDNSLSDPAEALKLFEQLKSQQSISVKLERNSQPLTMQYTIR